MPSFPDLSQFSDDELIEEIARRLKAKEAKERAVIQPCDECGHFMFATSDIPDHYNPCSEGFRMSFRQPEDLSDTNWGFYRRNCRRFVQRSNVEVINDAEA